MSSAAPLSTVGEEKLKTERIADGDTTCVRFDGVMDESFEGKRLASSIRSKNVILDMGRVLKISSFGIREWSEFVGQLMRTAENIYLIECTAKVMDQVNMVAGFVGKARIVSFYGPYRCDHCDIDQDVVFRVDRDGPSIRAFEPPEHLCSSCARPMFFDEDPGSFFSTVAQQPQFDLARGIPEFLAARLNYDISGGNRRLQIDKYVEGSNTYLRFSGNLDGAFSSEKVAEGLEGHVVVDVSGLGGVDIAGAAEWRNFTTLARGGAQRLYLLDCPPVLLERLPRTEDLGDEVISFTMPYNCPSCSTTTSEIVDVAEHYDILKFATPPEMKCGNCKKASVCAAQESLLSRLRDLQKPTADGKLRAFIKTARKRKPALKAGEAEQAAMVAGKKTIALVSVSLTAVLAAAGLMIYNAREQSDTENQLKKATEKIDELVKSEKMEKPSWVTFDNEFSAVCSPEIGQMVCVGSSSYLGTLEEAKDQARNVTLEGVARALAVNITADAFEEHVRPLYSDNRQRLLTAFEKASSDRESEEYKDVVKQIADIRRRAANAIVASSNDNVPTQHAGLYWEKYDDKAGKEEFRVYTRFVITTAAERNMLRIYTEEEQVAGGKVLTGFPLLAWSHEDFEGGVLVTEATGSLKAAGNDSLILNVDGQDVVSTTDFAKAMKPGASLGIANPMKSEASDGDAAEEQGGAPDAAAE